MGFQNRGKKMWKPRGKSQFFILSLGVCLFVFVVYDRFFDGSPTVDGDEAAELGRLGRLQDVAPNPKPNVQRDFGGEGSVSEVNNELNEEEMNEEEGDFSSSKSKLFPGFRLVHLDLKGAPPKVEYYSEFFPLVRKLGGTGLVIEYEDMFPYKSAEVSAKNAYKPEEIKHILELAAKHNLEVIPLIQVFGHMEFVLKLGKYMHLREDSKFPQAICPTNNGTAPLLHGLIDDIVELHPNIKYLHIGCDEVFALGECQRCLKTMTDKKWDKQTLFLHHVSSIARYIKMKYPHLTVLTWDDEFRNLSLEQLEMSGIGELIEPVVWKYTPEISSYLPSSMWQVYSTVFKNVWIASAFKGARDPNSIILYTSNYFENHKAWAELVSVYASKVSFKGVILTGWQRFDHFSVLCELLPVAVPSLAINLLYLSGSEKSHHTLASLVQRVLKCSSSPVLSVQSNFVAKCKFPGAGVFESINELPRIIYNIQKMKEESSFKGWVSNYNIDRGFSSPMQVEHATIRLRNLLPELTMLEFKIIETMSEVYDNFTINEWIYTYIKPHKDELEAIQKGTIKILGKDEWPRRPLESGEL